MLSGKGPPMTCLRSASLSPLAKNDGTRELGQMVVSVRDKSWNVQCESGRPAVLLLSLRNSNRPVPPPSAVNYVRVVDGTQRRTQWPWSMSKGACVSCEQVDPRTPQASFQSLGSNGCRIGRDSASTTHILSSMGLTSPGEIPHLGCMVACAPSLRGRSFLPPLNVLPPGYACHVCQQYHHHAFAIHYEIVLSHPGFQWQLCAASHKCGPQCTGPC